MNDEPLHQLPRQADKIAEMRKIVELGVANGWINPPSLAHVILQKAERNKRTAERKREAMAKAQEARLSKSKIESSRYYRDTDQISLNQTKQ